MGSQQDYEQPDFFEDITEPAVEDSVLVVRELLSYNADINTRRPNQSNLLEASYPIFILVNYILVIFFHAYIDSTDSIDDCDRGVRPESDAGAAEVEENI